MRKLLKRTVSCFLIAVMFWCGTIFADKQTLHDELIRLHVVGASDSEADQQLKLMVKDAVVDSLQTAMAGISDAQAARDYLAENLPKIQEFVNQFLAQSGSEDCAVVTLGKEVFDLREYDTFRLPAGVYASLRITIGEGEGKNWWCVVFPTLCAPATTEGFEDVAAASGFEDPLACALSRKDGYELRFYLLDAMGKLENFFCGG